MQTHFIIQLIKNADMHLYQRHHSPPLTRALRAPRQLCTLKDSCLCQYLDQETPHRTAFALPLPALSLKAAWRVTQRAAAASARPHVSQDPGGLLPSPVPVVSVHIHTTRRGLPSPLPELKDGLLLAQQLQTSSSLTKPANISAI